MFNQKIFIIFSAVSILLVSLVTIFQQINVSALSPKKTIKMVAIGDSLTYGTGDPLKKGYIHRVKTGIENNFDASVSLTNFGVSGYRTDQVIRQLQSQEKQQALMEANYIFLFIGTNDFRKSANYNFEALSIQKMEQGKKNYANHLLELITFIRSKNHSAPLIILGLYNPYTSIKTKETIDLLISDWNKEIKKAASLFSNTIYVPTFDLFPASLKDYYFSDTIHPNPKGYQQIANRVLRHVNNHVKSRK